MITLRAHHLLCLPRFAGEGYNPKFVRNLASLADCLDADSGQSVQLVSGPDDICLHCPHCMDSACTLEGNGPTVLERDRRVLSLLELEAGDCRPYSELQKKLSGILVHFTLRDVCGDCRWLGTCLRFAKTQIP